MTLDKDRKKNLRPPMRRGAMIAWISAVVVALVFVIVVLIVSGQSLF
jgi:hypothetical protein